MLKTLLYSIHANKKRLRPLIIGIVAMAVLGYIISCLYIILNVNFTRNIDNGKFNIIEVAPKRLSFEKKPEFKGIEGILSVQKKDSIYYGSETGEISGTVISTTSDTAKFFGIESDVDNQSIYMKTCNSKEIKLPIHQFLADGQYATGEYVTLKCAEAPRIYLNYQFLSPDTFAVISNTNMEKLAPKMSDENTPFLVFVDDIGKLATVSNQIESKNPSAATYYDLKNANDLPELITNFIQFGLVLFLFIFLLLIITIRSSIIQYLQKRKRDYIILLTQGIEIRRLYKLVGLEMLFVSLFSTIVAISVYSLGLFIAYSNNMKMLSIPFPIVLLQFIAITIIVIIITVAVGSVVINKMIRNLLKNEGIVNEMRS